MKFASIIPVMICSLALSQGTSRITDPPQVPLRPVAEFERAAAVLIAYPFGIPVSFIQAMSEDVLIYCLAASFDLSSAESQLISAGIDMDQVIFVGGNVDSYWTQDYGPFFVVDGNNDMVIVDFEYNRPRPNDNMAPYKMSVELGVDLYDSDVVHNGGNLMFDGYDTAASSTIVYTENPFIDVDERMMEFYGAVHHMTTPDPTTNYHQHINCWAKFLSPEKLMIISVPENHPYYQNIENTVEFYESQVNCFGEPYKIYRVMTPNNEPYANTFILNDKVYVPIGFGGWDDDAIEVYEEAMPGYEVIGIDDTWLDPWLPTDALHCRVLAIPDIQMLEIFHNPVDDQEFPLEEYDIRAMITDLSGEGVIDSTVFVHWINDLMENYEPVQMAFDEDENMYVSSIPSQPMDTEVRYYITASDNSGRNERLPIAGYYSFNAVGGVPADPGDVNMDESLNILDIVMIVNHITNESLLTGYSLYLADVNSDGLVNILDVIVIINNVLDEP